MDFNVGALMSNKDVPEADQQAERRNLINDHIGKRIRLQRTNMGLSAAALGRFLNVRYQQIHFYERGENQVTSSALYNLSRALDVPISFFFDGISEADPQDRALSQPTGTDSPDKVNVFSVKDIKEIEQEVRNLTEIYHKIEDKATRNSVLEFLKVLGRRY